MSLNNSKKRDDWIDFCKFIIIFYMVWGHVGMPAALDKYIHVFHMPIFFFLSGYLFNIDKIKNFKTFLIKKTKALLVPYFLFPIAIYCFWVIVYKFINKPIPETQLSLWRGLFTVNAIISPFAAVQWFLTCLFLVEIMFYIIIRIIKSNRIVLIPILILFSLMGYYYTNVINFRLYWGLDTALTALVFYGVGYLLNDINNHRIKSLVFSPSLFKLIILFILSLIFTSLNGYVNMRTLQYSNYFLYYLSSLTSIMMYIMLAMYVCKTKKINSSKVHMGLLYIGQNTLVVLVLNQLFIKSLNMILSKVKIYRGISNGNLKNLLFTIVIIALMLPASYILNKYLPFTIGKKISHNK